MNRQPLNREMDFKGNNGINDGYKTKIMCSETFPPSGIQVSTV